MNLVIESRFRPFTYDEMVKPLVQYKEAYEKVEQDYSDLTAQTEMWKDIANQTNSPEAYAMYNRYSQDLAHITDSFSKGMNLSNRQALLGMKRRYAQDITPIAQASEAMKAANDLRDKLGSDAIFEVGRYNSLDDFLHGKTANNKYESRKDIATRTAALAQATAQSILEDPIIKSSMSPQFLEIIQKRGLGSLDELQAAIAGNPAAANRFAQIKSQMIDQLGGIDRFDAEGRRAVEGAIHEGMFAGLNNYQTSLQQNGEYMTKAQRDASSRAWSELNFRKEQAAAQAAASAPRAILGDDGKPTGNYYDPKIGMVTDGSGNIIGDPAKVGTKKTTTAKETTKEMTATERKSLMTTISKPLYFNAGGGSGDSAHRDTSYYEWQGGTTEGYERPFSLLKGKGKTRALNYIGQLINVPDFAAAYEKMTPAQKQVVDETLEKNVKVWRDQDWFSDNHFAVYLRGANHLNPGTPGNEAELAASYDAIRALAGTASTVNSKPK